MIKSFGDGETRRVFEREPTRRYGAFTRILLRKLLMVDAAESFGVLRFPPGNRLEALQDDRAGQYSIRVNQQYRICFEWREGHAHRVEVVDYH